MTEGQLRLYPPLKTLPVYDETDERSHALVAGPEKPARRCATMAEVEACLKDPKLVPLGGVRVGQDGRQVVVVYFGEVT